MKVVVTERVGGVVEVGRRWEWVVESVVYEALGYVSGGITASRS